MERRPGDPRAASLLDRHRAHFGSDPLPVPVEAIARDLLGLRVREVDGLGVSGAILPAERLILLNPEESAPRRRFTLAHEIAHWVCHCSGGPAPAILCRDPGLERGASPREREANVFAAEVLMPEAEAAAAYRADREPDRAADRFGVSSEAMAWRWFNLGLTSDRPSDPAGG